MKSFLYKYWLINRKSLLRTHNDKMYTDSLTGNTPNTPKLIQPIYPNWPIICIFEKSSDHMSMFSTKYACLTCRKLQSVFFHFPTWAIEDAISLWAFFSCKSLLALSAIYRLFLTKKLLVLYMIFTILLLCILPIRYRTLFPYKSDPMPKFFRHTLTSRIQNLGLF